MIWIGCYDDLGAHYVIPIYILIDPRFLIILIILFFSNLITDEQPMASLNMQSTIDPGPEIKLKVRLSNAKDIVLALPCNLTISHFKQKLAETEGFHPASFSIKAIYMGKILTDNTCIADIGIKEKTYIQVSKPLI